MNIKLRTEAKNDFEKDFFRLMNNYVFRKTTENVRKHGDFKLVTTDKKISKLVSEPNYDTTKYFSENLLAVEMKKIKVKMNKPVYLRLEISKTLKFKYLYHYIISKYQINAKLCYMDSESFIIHIKN